jgi:hypothetical protein
MSFINNFVGTFIKNVYWRFVWVGLTYTSKQRINQIITQFIKRPTQTVNVLFAFEDDL